MITDSTPLLTDANFNICFNNLHISVSMVFLDLPNPHRHYIEHYHHDYEMRFVEAGQEYIRIHGKDLTVQAGDLYLIGPKVIHRRRSDLASPSREICIRFNLALKEELNNALPSEHEFSSLEREELTMYQLLSRPNPYVFQATQKLVSSFYAIVDCYEKKEAGHLLYGQVLMTQLMVELFRIVALHHRVQENYPVQRKTVDDKRMDEIVRFVEVNYNNNISLQDVENLLHISSKQVNRIVQRYFGMTFNEYFNQFRFDTALNLLATTDMSIEDIAFASGFNNVQRMHRMLKARKNMSASQLREFIRKEEEPVEIEETKPDF